MNSLREEEGNRRKVYDLVEEKGYRRKGEERTTPRFLSPVSGLLFPKGIWS